MAYTSQRRSKVVFIFIRGILLTKFPAHIQTPTIKLARNILDPFIIRTQNCKFI